MTAFSADWLALREPIDAGSRAATLTRRLADAIAATHADRPSRITDLASGTGANLRYLAAALGGRQDWRLVDHDPALLDALPARMRRWAGDAGLEFSANGQALSIENSDGQALSIANSDGQCLSIGGPEFECTLRLVQTDLADDLAACDFPDGGLVTASALLDLVSEAWLDSLARRCLEVRAPVLFTLSYDGRIDFLPGEADDPLVRDLVNRHQRTDKGFGPALGPAAADAGKAVFEALGYRVELGPSDWQLGPAQGPLQEALVSGWFEAALEMAPEEKARLISWRSAREDAIRAGRSELVVGHQDLLGMPPG